MSYSVRTISTFALPTAKKVVLLDAGHGGWDPGKVGQGDVLEKDINLQISAKLQRYLEQSGAFVITTRVDDSSLGSNKRSDLLGRKEIAVLGKADLFISIHQNSYPGDSIKGAQVFYNSKSEKSKLLAQCIQTEIKSFLQISNHRVPKSDANYYLLKQSEIPAVIVECGFLSNHEELQSLSNEEYQEKMAWAIFSGIVAYYNNAASL